MPSVHSIPRLSTSQPSPVPQTFVFPTNDHLLITTPSRILSWDSLGLHELFSSSKSGIAAATESKDGSGILAIADRHVVVLHDTKRGKDKSWGLSAEEDEVRHLEYTKDSKNLYLSTKVTNAIQCYSTEAQRLCSPPQTLASPPAALAVSPTGHLMISAQGAPPVVFLKDLAKNSSATLLKPQASASGISNAAFHPERANIFLLAFEDGTVAVYDASQMTRGSDTGKYTNQQRAGKAEIGRLEKLHRAVRMKDEGTSRAISGAAFIPGHKLRVVTAGFDGRCKLVDFSIGAKVLRTWHAKAPLTSLSVVATSSQVPATVSRKGKEPVRSTDQRIVIAVGTQDGHVLLYDSLGLMQSRQEINVKGERIISVEWICGSSPKSIQTVTPREDITTALSTVALDDGETVHTTGSSQITPKHLSMHPALRPSTTHPIASVSHQSRRFTIHPDEVIDDSTVRHTPNNKDGHMVSAEAGEYLDLFSPVNPFAVEQSRANRQQAFSPTRSRPRISSQTFAKDVVNENIGLTVDASSRRPKLFPTVNSNATSSGSPTHLTGAKRNVQFRSGARGSPLKSERRRVGPVSVRKREMLRADSMETVDATISANARLLRDLRQMSTQTPGAHAGSVLQGYASTRRDGGKQPVREPQRLMHLDAQVAPLDIRPEGQPIDTQVYGAGGRWPTDSVDEQSIEEQQDDIWNTSDEERKQSSHRNTRYDRPAARQTSRSRMDSKGTVSTAQTFRHSPTTEIPRVNPPASNMVKGVISTDDYATARSHLSPDGAFQLASDDVKSVFPRTSSKSPRKSRKDPNHQSRRSPKHRKTALQEFASNAALGQPTSDRWATVKEAKSSPQVCGKIIDPASHEGHDRVVQSHARGEACSGCTANAAKVMALEGDVSHMKGEILALRAMLRRNGIPTPVVPRR